MNAFDSELVEQAFGLDSAPSELMPFLPRELNEIIDGFLRELIVFALFHPHSHVDPQMNTLMAAINKGYLAIVGIQRNIVVHPTNTVNRFVKAAEAKFKLKATIIESHPNFDAVAKLNELMSDGSFRVAKAENFPPIEFKDQMLRLHKVDHRWTAIRYLLHREDYVMSLLAIVTHCYGIETF